MIIKTLEAPCARGKSRYAINRIVNERGWYLFVAPTIELLRAVEKAVNAATWEKHLSRFAQVASRMHVIAGDVYDSVTKEVIDRHLTTPIIGVTHEMLRYLPPEVFAGRAVIIDEMPQWITTAYAEPREWQMVIREGLVALEGDTVTVTQEGKKWLKSKEKQGQTGVRRWLREMSKRPTRKASNGWWLQEIDFSNFSQASEVVVMAANMSAKWFPEYVAEHGIILEPIDAAAHGISTAPHQCSGTDIIYALDYGGYTSNRILKSPEYQKIINRPLETRCRADRDCPLRHPDDPSAYVVAMNKAYSHAENRSGKGRRKKLFHVDSEKIVSPTIRGVNHLVHATSMIWLATMQPDPDSIRAVKEITGADVRSSREIVQAAHIESLYQFVYRGKLRENEQTELRIFTPTRGEAEALAAILNPRKVEACTKRPKSPPRGRRLA